MTHARQKGSPGPSDGRPLWPRGGAAVAMADAWTERSLRFGRTKKIVVKQRGVPAERADGENGRTEKKSRRDRKADPGRDEKRDRKSYPLRGRAAGSGGEGLSCRVLLTRLDESVGERKCSGERAARREPSLGARTPKSESVKRKEAEPRARSKSKSGSPSRGESAHVPPARKRRLASLNAEAVNSLLLERAGESRSAAKRARRRGQTAARGASPDAKAAGSGGGPKASRRSSEKVEKVKRAAMSQESLDAPAPRRLAGLNAAALLRLTSCSASSEQRAKNGPASDRKAARRHSGVKHKARPQRPRGGEAASRHGGGGGCTACEEKKKKKKKKKKADFEPKVAWDAGGCTRRLTKPGYESRGVLAFPLKQVKEEQLEAELSPYYCCPPEGSVEYCHRLAFFLGQQPCGGPERPALAAARTPVKAECLAPPPPLSHSHAHAHAALTLSPHPCLCTADHCFSSYYVHIAHPTTHAATTATSAAAAASLASRPLNFAPAGLCPNRTAGSKLLGPPPRGEGPPPRHACCNSVASACYGDACGIGGYAYRAVPPPASRGCSFSAACAGCTRAVKTEGYSSSPPAPPPVSSCPLSGAPTSTSTQTRPRPLTSPSGRARLKLAPERPQSHEPAVGAPSGGRSPRPPQRHPPPAPSVPSGAGAKQKRVGRRRATNGWRPVGAATERDVFIAGEDETAPRQCYEGVERDGEAIHVRDTVLLRSGPRKKSLPYVAKISALWDDPKTGELMMSLFWYYRPEHTQGGRDPGAHCENEIFASRHQDENSVACIEDRCYVLPLAQYCRFCALVKRRAEGAAPPGGAPVVPCGPDFAPPSHRCVPTDVDPELVYLCRHVYDFRFGRVLKNLQ